MRSLNFTNEMNMYVHYPEYILVNLKPNFKKWKSLPLQIWLDNQGKNKFYPELSLNKK